MSTKSLFRLAVLLAHLFFAVRSSSGAERPIYQRHTSDTKIVGFAFAPATTKAEIIDHLGRNEHAGKFKLADLEKMTVGELKALHDDDHAGVVDWGLLAQAIAELPIKFGTAGAVTTTQTQPKHFTPNFEVEAPTAAIAKSVALTAERCREDLAVEWLDEKLPDWSERCQIRVKVGQIGAGGSTTFEFTNGHAINWRMNVQGPLERILKSVIPHEVSHTIFASYLRHALPRWADEGAATLAEEPSERQRHHKLIQESMSSYGNPRAPLRTFLQATEYPSDMRHVMTLYATGYSLTNYLVQQGGKPHFLNFIREVKSLGWNAAIKKYYGDATVEALEQRWSSWVRSGQKDLGRPKAVEVAAHLAATPRASTPRVIVFSAPWCGVCKTLKADLRNPAYENDFGELRNDFEFVEEGTAKYVQHAARFRATTGKQITDLPTIWVAGTKEHRTGYSATAEGRRGLCGWIKSFFRLLFGFIFGEPKVVVVPPPPVITMPPTQKGGDPIVLGPQGPLSSGEVPPPVEVMTEPDWGYVRIVGVAKKFLGDGANGVAVKLAIEQGRGRILDRINRLMDGKAHFDLVTERVEPETFLAVKTAARIEPNPVSGIVLVRKLTDGLVRGIIERRAAAVVEGHVPGDAIKIVFESSQPELFAAIQAALLTIEPSPVAATPFVSPTALTVDNGGLIALNDEPRSPFVSPPPSLSTEPSVVADAGELPLPVVPVVAEPANWRGLTIVVLGHERLEVTGVKAVGLAVALDKLSGPITRVVNEKFGDKVALHLVFERLDSQKAKYAAICTAAGVTPDPGFILILVEQRDLGLKGLIVKKVQSIITEKFPDGLPFDVIFQRQHPTTYAAIQAAILTPEVATANPQPVKTVADSPVSPMPSSGLIDDVKQAAADGVSETITALDAVLQKRDKELVARMEQIADEKLKAATGANKTDDHIAEQTLWSRVTGGTGLTILGCVARMIYKNWRDEKRLLAAVADVPPTQAA